MDNDISEIDKLTERISKDPKSKLFVPLAEEYKKAGDIEMSIHVLTEGLKNNPGYVTARSFLGRLLYEKGDIAGAQREFEEVVKSIPDNLMAQRKLGDLYILQDRSADALKQYKKALSLNPRDEETASLVADVEAGRDIKSKIFQPKPREPEAPLQREVSPQAAPSPAQPKPTAAPISAGAMTEAAEEAEEVLVVEPLEASDSVSLENALSSENLGFSSEPAQEPEAPTSEKEGDVFFDHSEPFAAPQMPEDVQGGEENFPEVELGLSVEEPDKQADDFTTDTLAELYISQGFFEKAVEIYERLFADNPGSQGLKNKLEKVKALAAEAAPAVEPEAQAGIAAGSQEFSVEPLPGEMPPAMASGFFDEEVPSPDQEIELSQPEDQWGAPAASSERTEKGSIPEAVRRSQQVDAGFVPTEYVPPDAVPRMAPQGTGADASAESAKSAAGTPQRPPASGRKETIDRLENWLQHILKEK